MGSTGKDIQIFRRNKELLPDSAIKDLKSSIKGEVIVKGEAADDIYRDAIDRWNKVWVQEAVRPPLFIPSRTTDPELGHHHKRHI